ncbi:acyltransferase family protein [Streptomyces violascens]|uniref:Acyltransferase n=1 Tax=Streptomyces violascens TaxID=67381 RepID=A0ABQ3QSF0_9ACTN|nr:acyltransferase [Streptomyces violascens]GGU32969.1 acyltransferase [Streptomyces violascens]GHI40216.1 acyltransferase [Streptomyces violascens]
MLPPTGSERLPSLTGLRFLLAACVLMAHALSGSAIFSERPQAALSVAAAPLATSAVAGFFVLSGFVLAWSYRPGDRARAFWRRRFWKIYPNHALGWALGALFFVVATAPSPMAVGGSATVLGGAAELFLLKVWMPVPEAFNGFNDPSWSVCCEAFFYLLFPVLIFAARRLSRTGLRCTWLALACAILTFPAVAMALDGRALPGWPLGLNALWFGYVFPPVRLTEFMLGMVTARLVQEGAWPRLNAPIRIGVLVTVLATTPFLPLTYCLGASYGLPFSLIVAGLAVRDIQGRSRLLARPAMVALGEASYALYIVHFPLLMSARQAVGVNHRFAVLNGVLFAAGLMVAAQLVALLVHRRYEQPIQARFARGTRAVSSGRLEHSALPATDSCG